VAPLRAALAAGAVLADRAILGVMTAVREVGQVVSSGEIAVAPVAVEVAGGEVVALAVEHRWP